MKDRWLSRLGRFAPWAETETASWIPRLAWLVAAVSLLGVSLLARPSAQGDALEYLLMTESLARHGTPEVRAGDLWSLGRQDERLGLGLNYVYPGYFDDPSGAWYSVHFWAYSLLAVPARLVLGVVGLSGLRAFPVTNALLLALALHRVLFSLPFRPRGRLALFVLLLLSPVLFFLRWPHAEVMTAACAMLSLVALHQRRHVTAALWAALGSLQSPPLTLLLILVWLVSVARDHRPRSVAKVTAAAALAGMAPLFYWAHFGTPSLIAREAASLSFLAPSRALELLFDLNIGLAPYLPVTVLLAVLASVWTLARVRRAPFNAALIVTIAAMALASTPTGNWNHGTIGPSRYAVWLLPLVVFLVVGTGEGLRGRMARGAFTGALVLAATSQAAVVLAKRGPLAEPDYLEHSWAARLVLRTDPAFYNPSYSIFASRTVHQPLLGPTLAVYTADGACRKALVQASAEHEAELRRRCGSIPGGAHAWFASPSDSDAWHYVDYRRPLALTPRPGRP